MVALLLLDTSVYKHCVWLLKVCYTHNDNDNDNNNNIIITIIPLSDYHKVVASNQSALPVLMYPMWTQT